MTTLTHDLRDASWRERAATVAIFLALGLGVGAWAAALPGLKATLGLSDRDLSIALLCVSVGSVGSTVATGILAPRFGTGRATGVAAFCAVVGCALPAFARDLAQLCAAALLLGAGCGALDIAMNGHASDVERRWLSPIMSSFHAAFSAGGLIGSALGGVLASAGWGVGGQLWTPLGLAVVLVGLAIPRLGTGARTEAGEGTGLAWPERAALGLCIVALSCFLIEGAMADWSGVYLRTVALASEGTAAAGYAAFSTTMVVGRVVGDRVVQALGPRNVVLFGGGLAVLGSSLAIAWPDPLAACLGFGLIGAGASNVVPVVFSAASRYGSSPSAGVAMVATFGYAGFLGGPPIIGALATLGGLRDALGLLVVGALVIAVGSSGIARRQH